MTANGITVMKQTEALGSLFVKKKVSIVKRNLQKIRWAMSNSGFR